MRRYDYVALGACVAVVSTTLSCSCDDAGDDTPVRPPTVVAANGIEVTRFHCNRQSVTDRAYQASVGETLEVLVELTTDGRALDRTVTLYLVGLHGEQEVIHQSGVMEVERLTLPEQFRLTRTVRGPVEPGEFAIRIVDFNSEVLAAADLTVVAD